MSGDRLRLAAKVRVKVGVIGCCVGCRDCYGYAIGCHNRPSPVIGALVAHEGARERAAREKEEPGE